MSFSIPPFELDLNMAYGESNGDVYFGWATKGSNTASSNWKIIMLDKTGNNWVKKYADGNANYDNVWDDVYGLTYTHLL